MDSAKIFAFGLAAGLTIAVIAHNRSKSKQPTPLTSVKASKNKKKKAKAGASTASPSARAQDSVHEVEAAPPKPNANVPAQTTKQSKKAKEQQQNRQAVTDATSYAEAASLEAEEAKAAAEQPKHVLPLSNESVRQKHTAHHAVLHDALGDMRDAQVDPVPAAYTSVARIPPPVAPVEREPLSQKDADEGWSSVGASSGRIKSAPASQQQNGSSTKQYASVASANPFAALPDDAPTATVKRLPKPAPSTSTRSNGANGKASAPESAETKKQRQNAQKAQAKKQAKEQAERERLERLADHRREQQRQAAKQRETAQRPTPYSTSSKQPSAKASVDLNGRLVWD